MSGGSRRRSLAPERRYHVLRAALALYGRMPAELDDGERAAVEERAAQAFSLEERILASPEAAELDVAQTTVDAAVTGVAGRYATHEEFLADLTANDLDETLLRRAVRRELICERILERIAAMVPPVVDEEVVAYYHAHAALYQQPELRTVRQILITINPDFPENTRAAVEARIAELHGRLREDPAAFPEMAERWSECPSALRGGLVGTVPRGRLAPELDAVLFSLEPGEIGEVVETELGLHIVLCEAALPARHLRLDEVRERIRERLTRERRHRAQQAWLRRVTTCV